MVLLMAILAMFIQSCVNDDIQENVIQDETEYTEYSQSVTKALNTLLSDMGAPQTRSESSALDAERVSYLLGLTSEDLELWEENLNSSIGEDFYDIHYDYDKIENAFSKDQLHQFTTFLKAYLNNGKSNNQEMIDSYTIGKSVEEHKLYVLGAVYIDSIVRPLLDNVETSQTRAMSHCELELAKRVLEDTAESVVMDIALDGLDNPVIDIYCTAGDVVAVLNAVHAYHRCRATL